MGSTVVYLIVFLMIELRESVIFLKVWVWLERLTGKFIDFSSVALFDTSGGK